MKHLSIYTDGSYRNSADVGGIGMVVVDDNGSIIQQVGESFEHTTNNKMEILAIKKALEYLNTVSVDEVDIYTDSQYCVGILSLGWKIQKNAAEWIALKNALDAVRQKMQRMSIHHVKGHESNLYNNLADELATKASAELKRKILCL